MRARTEVEVAVGEVENDWDLTLRFEGLQEDLEDPIALGRAFKAAMRDGICSMLQRGLTLDRGSRWRDLFPGALR